MKRLRIYINELPQNKWSVQGSILKTFFFGAWKICLECLVFQSRLYKNKTAANFLRKIQEILNVNYYNAKFSRTITTSLVMKIHNFRNVGFLRANGNVNHTPNPLSSNSIHLAICGNILQALQLISVRTFMWRSQSYRFPHHQRDMEKRWPSYRRRNLVITGISENSL
jgi:hypothetical protein